MSNSLDPDQALIWVQSVCKSYQQTILVEKELRIRFIGPDLGLNCLPKLSADNTGRQRVKDIETRAIILSRK